MTRHDLEQRLRGIRWSMPSPELRGRTLSAASVMPTTVPWSDRIWFSRGWRLSAAAVTIGLFGMLSWPVQVRSDLMLTVSSPDRDAGLQDFVRDAGFPEDVARAVTRRSRAGVKTNIGDGLRVALDVIEGGN